MTAEALNETTLTTLEALEARLLRLEHVLHGHPATQPASTPSPSPSDEPASKRMQDMERRLNGMVSRVRVYGELLRIRTCVFFFFLCSLLEYTQVHTYA